MGLIQSTRWVTPLELALTEARLTALLKSNQAQLQAQITQLQQGVTKMAADLTGIQQAVADETTVEQGAITLLTQLSQMLAAAKNDPAQVQAIIDQINTNKSALAAAVTANTPAAA